MNIQTYSVPFRAQADATGQVCFKPHRGLDIIAIEKVYRAETGAVTAHTIDVKVDGTEVKTGICAGADTGKVYDWLSHAAGGSDAPIHVNKDETVSVDISDTGGTNATFDLHFHVAYGRA